MADQDLNKRYQARMIRLRDQMHTGELTPEELQTARLLGTIFMDDLIDPGEARRAHYRAERMWRMLGPVDAVLSNYKAMAVALAVVLYIAGPDFWTNVISPIVKGVIK